MAPPTLEVITPAAARMHALGTQGLLEPVASVEEALVRTAGVSGAIPSGPLSLAARVRDFSPSALDRALLEDRSVVRVPAMRGAVYLLPTHLAASGLALAKPGQFRQALTRAGMKEEAYDALVASLEARLAGGMHLTGAELRRALGSERIEKVLPKGTYVFFLRGLSHEGRILRVGVRGGARSQAFEYGRTDEWLGEPLRVPRETEGLAELLPYYLNAHGPASLKDLAWWAGVTQKVARAALESQDHREVRLEGREDVLYASESLPTESDMMGDKASVILLPHWDPYLTAHVDRTRYLPERWHERVIDRGGNSTNVILRDGKAVGVWDYTDGIVAYAGFTSRLNPDALRASSKTLAPVLGDLNLDERDEARRLHESGQNAFQSPLRGSASSGD